MEASAPRLTYPERCLGCGHCIAVCPKNAISEDALDMGEVVPIPAKPDSTLVSSLMQARRSCRHYTAEPVSEADLQRLLTAARYCPTAKNLQATRYIAVTKRIPALLDAALEGLGKVGTATLETAVDCNEIRRAESFIRWAAQRKEDRTFDPLFFHAPLLLMFVAEGDPRDAAAAAAYTELMAASLGLGCLYSGYFTACAAESQDVRTLLQLKPNESVVRCLVLGHPDIRFLRTVPRRQANLTRI